MNCKVVFGSSFGNEGKGKVVHTISKDWADLIVRCNGGFNTTNGIKTQKGVAHTYSQVGVSALDGIPTYLSRFYVVHPQLFIEELDILSFRNNGASISDIYVDGECLISLPYDTLVFVSKQIALIKPYTSAYFETLLRSSNFFSICIFDLFLNDDSALFKKLMYILHNYTLPTIAQLNLSISSQLEHILTDEYLKSYIKTLRLFQKSITLVSDSAFLSKFNNVVFQSSQGILSENTNQYLFNSPSSLDSVLILLANSKQLRDVIDRKSFEAIYVTRVYITQYSIHKVIQDSDELSEFNIFDDVNKPTPFEGYLSTSYLDVNLLTRTLTNHFTPCSSFAKGRLHVTCIDHINDKGKFPFILDNKKYIIDFEDISKYINVFNSIEYSDSPYSI